MYKKDLLSKLPSIRNFSFWLFFAFILFFHGWINGILDFFLVNPLFSHFENIWLTNIVLVLFVTLIIRFLVKYFDKDSLIIVAIATICFYGFQRGSSYWIFMPSVFWESLFIWDIVALAFILPIAKVFIRDRKNEEDKPVQIDGFIEDLPITKISSDSFNRSVLAKEIRTVISRTHNERSFAIGVLGGYGSGKTSFLNLVEANLYGKAISLIKFQPWTITKVDSLQNAFFDTLIEYLAYENPELSTSFYHYSRKLKHADVRIQNQGGGG